jgi:hypothetical protein
MRKNDKEIVKKPSENDEIGRIFLKKARNSGKM